MKSLKDDKLHCDNGPAEEYIHGSKCWYQHGKQHRLDGPAVELPNGCKFWYYEGKHISVNSQEEFERYLNLIAFI